MKQSRIPIDKIKKHFEENWKIYAGDGIGLGVAGISALIVRTNVNSPTRLSRRSAHQLALAGVEQVNVGSHVFNAPVTNNFVNHLSYIVSQDGTDNWWRSQAEAARALGISSSRISDHINHGAPLAGGISLTRQGVSL